MGARWSEHEDAVLDVAYRNGFRASEIVKANLLPGRNATAIQCRLNILRCRREGKCMQCGASLPEGWLVLVCATCQIERTNDQRAWRGARLVQGLCARCEAPLDEASTLTRCAACEKALSKHRKPRKKEPKQRSPSQGFVRWAGSRTLRRYVQLFPAESRVVDLFGGSGAYALIAAQEGHQVVAWNDLHRGLYTFMTCLQKEQEDGVWDQCERLRHLSPEELSERYRERVLIQDPLELAAVTYITALSIENLSFKALQIDRVYGAPTLRQFKDRARILRKYLCGTKFLNLDYRRVMRVLDRPDTFFFCDPPYPGLSMYDHNFNGEHEELFQLLRGLRGRFMVVLHSSRRSGMLMTQLAEKAEVRLYKNYLRRGPSHIRELVAVNYDIGPLPDHLQPFDPATYGL